MTKESAGLTKEDLVATVRRAQAGDQAAFTDLFMALHKPVLNYVYRTVGDRQVAEDVTQDAFIRAHARIDQLGPPWDFKSWIYRIASNLAIDHLRRGKRFVDVEEPMELGGSPTTRRPAERGVQQHESEQAVKKTLELMQTRYRQALILKEINDLSYREISNTLECSYDNARQLVHRARLHFRELHGIRLLAESGASSCVELGNLLSAFQDGELGEDEQKAVKAHLAVCEHCQETEKDLKRVAGIFAFLPPLVPSSGWLEQTLQQIQSQAGLSGSAAKPGAGAGHGAGGSGPALVKSAGLPRLLVGGLAGAVGVAALVLAAGFALGWFGGPNDGPQPYQAAVEHTVEAVLSAETAPAVQPPESAEDGTGQGLAAATSPATSMILLATSTPTPSPTLGPPIAIALVNSNCRGGPNVIFDVLGYLMAGEQTRIRGRDSLTNWWVVDQMDGTGTCWVANNLTEEEGDLTQVPVVQAPPTPTPEDTSPPSVQISYAPTGTWKPDEGDTLTFTATASDDRSVRTIEIFVKSPTANALQKVKTCSNTTSCVYQGGPYPAGTVGYQAMAIDAAGNSAETAVGEIRV
ncbi:MAG: sigma-70 family RNA polymerase sigma factor, partial [Anaerolineales bacterium]